MARHFILASLTLALAGCGVAGKVAPGLQGGDFGALARRSATAGLVVLPEAGTAPIVQAIASAQKSVDFTIYMMTNRNQSAEVVQALVAKAQAGVPVRVILDGRPFTSAKPPECKPGEPTVVNQPAFDALKAAGVQVRWSDPKFRFTHQKSFIVDGKTAYVMTANMTASAFTVNREYVVPVTNAAMVGEIARIFQADFTGGEAKPVHPDLVVSPTNSRARILSLIDSATKAIDVQVEYIKDPELLAHLGAKAKAGVQVTAVMAAGSKDACSGYDPQAEATKAMQQAGITRFAFATAVKMHAKALIADGARCYIGSENFTTNSLNNNRELGLLSRDPKVIATLAATMAKDWAATQGGARARATSLGFLVGDEPQGLDAAAF